VRSTSRLAGKRVLVTGGGRGEAVEAFVVLVNGVEPSDELAENPKGMVRDTYSKQVYPRAVHFVASLPKTSSGKVQRYILRQQV
jgi:acetyl-CoA synthetase